MAAPRWRRPALSIVSPCPGSVTRAAGRLPESAWRRSGLGWLGVFVPGLPTTIFLIIASYCFARSCPWLEDRLLRIPLFAPYMKVLDEGRGMSRKAATSALVSMWSCVALSLTILFVAGRLTPWVAGLIVLLAGVGSATILYYARPRTAV